MIRVLTNVKGKIKEGTLKDLKKRTTEWLDAYKPTKKEITDIATELRLPLSEVIRYLDPNERPKVVEFDDCSLIIISCPVKEKEAKVTSLAIFLTKHNNVVTLRSEAIDAIDKLRDYFTEKKESMRTPGIVLRRLLRWVINSFYQRLDEIEDNIDAVESDIVKRPERLSPSRLFKVKKGLIYFHKALIANREVVSSIQMEYVSRVNKKELPRFREIYFEFVQLVDMNETYRDILTSVVESYLTSISNNLNIIIKRLTVYGSYILVPTLIAGIYGMNFKTFPELGWKYGYAFSLLVMILSVFAMHYYFKRKGWV